MALPAPLPITNSFLALGLSSIHLSKPVSSCCSFKESTSQKSAGLFGWLVGFWFLGVFFFGRAMQLIGPRPSAVRARSCNRWTAREFPEECWVFIAAFPLRALRPWRIYWTSLNLAPLCVTWKPLSWHPPASPIWLVFWALPSGAPKHSFPNPKATHPPHPAHSGVGSPGSSTNTSLLLAILALFFFFNKFIYLFIFIFGCIGSSLLCAGFL